MPRGGSWKMHFIDEISFKVEGGHGGNGCVSFRREKFVPKGGPDGGDGGNGGDVIAKVNEGMTTLLDLKRRRSYRAESGQHGMGKNMYGRRGKDVVIHVPRGTMVKDMENGVLVGDMTEPGQVLVLARGGKGGKGNTHFARPTLQAPDWAENGTGGEVRNLKLELKILADVGLVGKPNAGKSTLLSVISAARPKIADYPFTTLTPNLGIVKYGEFQSFVVADIPGLIEGAHEGKGLGDRFLRHIERTRVLIFLVESCSDSPKEDYRILMDELTAFNRDLVGKPVIVALTKIDLIPVEERKELPRHLGRKPCIPVSAVSGEGIQTLLDRVFVLLSEVNRAESV